VGTDADPIEFHKLLDQRYEEYRKWALLTMREAPEAELWTRWLTPEYPKERIAANASELTYQYRQAKGVRKVVEGGYDVIKELYRRGYTLGIISNLIGCHEVQDWLEEDELTPYFKSVVLSSVTGLRKPDPAIYLMASREAGVEPEKCACVGDNISRDIVGGKLAGYGLNIAVSYPDKPLKKTFSDENRPDAVVEKLIELLDIFPQAPYANLEHFLNF
ncbi:MAG TPA: hypothetical protein DD738_02330, partial [Ruminiclostridium sp.]|nr:hypothetical protein [Ruminiclostridium sp.]